ncbi:MAG: RIP metalloprotease RseP [Schleiferiaceae bacterium]|nr:RIP metalloprotease RseP [Schleiferiaceae bacterium]
MLIQIAQFVLGLSILIVLHEFGHYLPAKWFKVRVSKFYLFFDYKFSLLKKKIGETEWGIGWIPLGGYVKIEGMVDESMDTENLKDEPEDWEFRAKPAWQRLIILTGGVIMNFITAYFIYVFLLMSYGKDYLPNDSLVYGIWTNEIGQEMGLENGDKILSIGDYVPDSYTETAMEIFLSEGEDIRVDRNGEDVRVPITTEALADIIADKSLYEVIRPRMPYVVGGFSEGSIGEAAGMQVGDSLVGLNGQQLLFFDEFFDAIPDFGGEEITLTYYRDGVADTLNIKVPNDGKIGVYNTSEVYKYYKIKNKEYSFAQALGGGWDEVGNKLSGYVRQFKLIFNFETKAYKEVGGFLMILQQYDSTWNWRGFWEFTAFLSIMLGFLNILPIPALDGGHVVFTLVEMVTGRRPSIKVLEVAQMIGFFLLLALLIFANGQDIIRAFFGG